MRLTSKFAALGLVLISRPMLAQTERTTQECSRLGAELNSAASDSSWYMALVSIYDCPDHVGHALIALWQDLPADSARRRLLFFASAHVHDALLYHELLALAQNRDVVDSIRLRAIEVLVTVADSSLLISVNPSRVRTLPDTTVQHPSVGIGGYSHSFVRKGRYPLPPNARDSVLALFSTLSTADSSADVRYVAKKAHDWLVRGRR